MPPKARTTSKPSTASNTSMTTRSEPTNTNSADSDNESLIEPSQLLGSSSLYNIRDQETDAVTGYGLQHDTGSHAQDDNNLEANAEIEISRQSSTNSQWSSEANNELAKFGKIDPTTFITKLEDVESFHSFEYTMTEYINNALNVNEDLYTGNFTQSQKRFIHAIIINRVNNTAGKHVLSFANKDGQEAMRSLRNLYLGTESNRQLKNMTDISKLKLSNHKSVSGYADHIRTLRNTSREFKIFGKNGEDLLVCLALNGLDERFEIFCTLIRNQVPLPSVETFLVRMLEFDTNLNLKNSNKFESVAHASVSGTTDNRLSRNKMKRKNPKSRANSVDVNAISHKPPHNGKRAHSYNRDSNKNPKQPTLNINPNKPPISCQRCFSRKNDHQISNCPSRLWCSKCKNASHESNNCRKR